MQVKWGHSAILSTFIKLPFVTEEVFVLSIFEWPPKTGFTEVYPAVKMGNFPVIF